jgi:hypothetical protein
MADVKLTGLPAAASVTTDDLVAIVDGADTTTKKATVSQVRAAIVPVAVASEISGLGGGVATFLTTPNNTNFFALAGIAATGSGNFVFHNSPSLTTPRINGSTLPHQYVFVVGNLAASRNVTMPLLTGDDTFVFAAHAETLTNKTFNVADNSLTSTGGAAGDLLVHNGTKWVRFAKGTDGQVLKMVAGDVAWDTDAGGSVAGSDTQVQFNDGGVMGADAGLTFNKTNNVLTVGGAITAGSTPSTAGEVRLTNAFTVKGRTAANSANLTALAGNASNALFVGCSSSFTEAWTTVQIFANTTLNLGHGSSTRAQATSSGFGIYNTSNLGLHGNSATFPGVGGGVGVFGIGNCNTVPTTNPASGCVAYAEAGAFKCRGSSGTVTTMAPADLDGFGGHCPSCGTDHLHALSRRRAR